MPVNSFSVGRDVTLNIQTPQGPLVSNLVTGFDSKPDMTEQKVKGLDGITRPVRFFDGWSGKFEIERQDDTLDSYFAMIEQNYYLGIPEAPCSITETIENPNGAISQYRYGSAAEARRRRELGRGQDGQDDDELHGEPETQDGVKGSERRRIVK